MDIFISSVLQKFWHLNFIYCGISLGLGFSQWTKQIVRVTLATQADILNMQSLHSEVISINLAHPTYFLSWSNNFRTYFHTYSSDFHYYKWTDPYNSWCVSYLFIGYIFFYLTLWKILGLEFGCKSKSNGIYVMWSRCLLTLWWQSFWSM